MEKPRAALLAAFLIPSPIVDAGALIFVKELEGLSDSPAGGQNAWISASGGTNPPDLPLGRSAVRLTT